MRVRAARLKNFLRPNERGKIANQYDYAELKVAQQTV